MLFGEVVGCVRLLLASMRVVRPWPRLPRAAVAAPSLAGLKARLDGAGSTLLWWKGSLPMAARGSHHPALVEGVPAHGRGLELGDL